ncbi:hypothetical protein FQN50_002816 [Emmonsiellopsis sp. PD_5]|nr:hypothetical protein FQN50_002816 [Emmonsiellopsis sp. PD_5]
MGASTVTTLPVNEVNHGLHHSMGVSNVTTSYRRGHLRPLPFPAPTSGQYSHRSTGSSNVATILEANYYLHSTGVF